MVGKLTYDQVLNIAKDLREQVEVLYYNSEDDFALKIKTKGNDEVYLYKNSSNKQFNLIYSEMWKKQAAYEGSNIFKKQDELKTLPSLIKC